MPGMRKFLSGFFRFNSIVVQLIALLNMVHAIMKVKSPQGAIAWVVALFTFPYVAVPLYWVFGRSKFLGYQKVDRTANHELAQVARKALRNLHPHIPGPDAPGRRDFLFTEKLVHLPVCHGNSVDLLVDGEETFLSIFEALHSARDYLLVQFFIVNDDALGRRFRDVLAARAREGVRVYFLYDDIGSRGLPEGFLKPLRSAGARVEPFKTTRGVGNRFQLNFRNHRKLVVADGKVALTGGLNVGNEYMGWSERFGPWRDTHVKVTGPSVQCLQIPFMEDWYFACEEILHLNWEPESAAAADQTIVTLPTGPVTELETCSLMFLRALNAAENRIWIASPYFVPDQTVVSALQLAALRGVEVRVLLPQVCDHVLPYLSSFTYVAAMERAGVELYRYQEGFMHQKVLLIDDSLATVGSINVDYRSFHLNFELAVMVADRDFAGQVEEMLKADFARSRRAGTKDLEHRPTWFKLASRIAHLLSPVQ